jgi:CRISPR-associated protein (TIGR03984 family)
MPQQLTKIGFVTETIPPPDDLEAWLHEQAATESWLLAHAVDGVIWGAVTKEWLATSHDVAPQVSPPLRLETLQQLRLFNAAYEVQLWRTDNDLQALRVTETADADTPLIDEPHLLWGTFAKPLAHGFTWLEDGAQGLVHILPPFEDSDLLDGQLGARTDNVLRRAFIHVRHYFVENDMGVNTIGMSRFMGLGVQDYGTE